MVEDGVSETEKVSLAMSSTYQRRGNLKSGESYDALIRMITLEWNARDMIQID